MEILMTLMPYAILLIIGFIFIRYKLKKAEEIALQKERETAKELFLRDFRKNYDPSALETNELTSEETIQKLNEALEQDFVEEVSFKFYQENNDLTTKEISSLWNELRNSFIQNIDFNDETLSNEQIHNLWKTMTYFPKDYALFCYRFFGKEIKYITYKQMEEDNK